MQLHEHQITQPTGLHAHRASELSKAARAFSCRIVVEHGEDSADAKDLIALLSLNLACGDDIEVVFEGSDETKASAALEMLIDEL